VRELLRRHPRFFLISALAGLALRFFFLFRFPAIAGDSFVYGDLAKNWLQHGVYGLSGPFAITPTAIRLPGYPAFLAMVFFIFGMEHYRAALVLQIFVDLGTCLLTADLARRLFSSRAAKTAFLLAALCPFLANYSVAALSETLEIFCTVLALDCAIAGLSAAGSSRTRAWFGCGAAVAGAILLRPDGGILLAAIGFYLLVLLVRSVRKPTALPVREIIRAGTIVAAAALAPLVPWTLRNWHTLHRFQPLAPRYANEEGEYVAMGFNRWVKTWMADYASVEDIYWKVSGDKIDADYLPTRAADSPEQREKTEWLIDDYNDVLHMTPELDARFAALANERIAHSPLRYYLWLPMVRIADMWLRPRTEMLPPDAHWWEFDDDLRWSVLAVVMGVIGLFYVGAGGIGLIKGRHAAYLGLLIVFVLLRSAFLGSLENPEPRYALECYPVVIALAARIF
jgi:4-amino-4-deoxy-L-arabinose transferase-like glycosyltransferase